VLKRIFIEKRLIILPILGALAANLIAYAAVIYPLATSVSGGEQRAAAAAVALKIAVRDQASAAATVTGKARAEKALAKFYKEILPADLPAAGRVMYLQLAQLARECNLRYARRMLDSAPVRESSLDALTMNMTLEGTYEDIRRFIYRIETGTPFVVIDNVALGQGREPNSSLAVTLDLTTYYRVARNGT
jgi:Tfp pilus assembly protein PilO